MSDTVSHTVTWSETFGAGLFPGLTALEGMRRTIAEKTKTPIAALIDMDLISVEPGVAVMEGRPGPQHVNPIRIVHGGFAATLLDATLWSAVQTTTEPGEFLTTLELKVNYARAMKPDMGPVRCEGRGVHRGKTVAIAEAKITGGDGKLYAYASSTLMIVRG